MADKNKYTLQSVDTALQIIDLFDTNQYLGLSDITKILKIGKATAFRLCYTLTQRGYLVKCEDGKYGLGTRFYTLGAIASDRHEIIHVIRPYLAELMNVTEETIHLVIWLDSYQVLLIDQILCASSIRVVSNAAAPRYAHCTSTGMTLLAAKSDEYINNYLNTVPLNPITPHSYTTRDQVLHEISKIRHDGFAINDQQFELGLMSISMPIYDRNCNPVAAISVSGPDSRITAKKELIIENLKLTTKQISKLKL